MSSPQKNKRALKLESYPPRMRIDQVADYLNCTDRHVAHLINSKALPAINVAGPKSPRKLYRVERQAVAAFVARRNV